MGHDPMPVSDICVRRQVTCWRDAAACDSFSSATCERRIDMVGSLATTVDAYLETLLPERRAVMAAVREVVRTNLPHGYTETMEWGMIGYGIPLERYPNTYNGQRLCYAAIAAQKNHYSLYVMSAY